MAGEEKEDRISSLPDSLLLEIISGLYTTKDVIKTTTTLSKRWQHLWTLLPALIFEGIFDIKSSHYIDYTGYVTFIEKTLAQCPTDVKLNEFILSICYNSEDYYGNTPCLLPINSFIRHAVTRNVQEVCLNVRDSDEENKFWYNDELLFNNSCIKSMDIVDCVFDPPNGAIRWDTLKCLSISGGVLDEDMIKTILSGSPVLETLNLNDCDGFQRIDVTSKSVKNLEFSTSHVKTPMNHFQYRQPIEINAPYILSLTINPRLYTEKLLLQNVCSLVKADLDYCNNRGYVVDTSREEELLKGLLQSLGHVNEITLGDYCFKVLSRLEATGFQFRKGSDLISRDLVSRGRYLGSYRTFFANSCHRCKATKIS